MTDFFKSTSSNKMVGYNPIMVESPNWVQDVELKCDRYSEDIDDYLNKNMENPK